MPTTREIFVYEFSPDGGKAWFPLCDQNGHRLWSSTPGLPDGSSGWSGLQRTTKLTMDFETLPDGFDNPGVYGTHHRDDSQTDWLDSRTKVAIRFTTGAKGFATAVCGNGHSFFLVRQSSLGEPIWRLVGDVLRWYQDTLQKLDPRGCLGRDCEVLLDGPEPSTREPATVRLGSEFRLWDFLHSWMASVGHKPWSDTDG